MDVRRIILTPRPLGRRRFAAIRTTRKHVLVVALVTFGLGISGLLASGGLTGATGITNISSVAFRTAVHKEVPQSDTGTVTPAAAAPSAPPTPTPTPPPPAPATPVQANVDSSSAAAWAASPGVVCIREHESGDNYAENTGNGYYGAYQDLLSTWEAAGGTGLPSDAPPAVQDQINYQIYLSGGWGQWSTAGFCGL